LALNDLVAKGELKAPIVKSVAITWIAARGFPPVPRDGSDEGRSDAIADWPLLNALVSTDERGFVGGPSTNGGGVGIGYSQHAGQVDLRDGTPEMAKRIERVLTNDPGLGVAPARGRGVSGGD